MYIAALLKIKQGLKTTQLVIDNISIDASKVCFVYLNIFLPKIDLWLETHTKN